MKSYTTTEELVNKIEAMKKDREKQQEWNAENEQILAFLIELHTLRMSYMHSFKEMKAVMELISNLQDEMQDERNLLVY